MRTCPDEETILAFVEHRLRPARRSAIEAHAAGCEACSALLAAVTSAWFTEGKLAGGGAPKRPAFAPGDRVGPYTIVARAGSGSMGDVYRARDDRLGRDVALKTLPDRFASDPERLARFRQEARAAGALSHPHVLTIFDVGTHAGTPYLVAEWLEGATLQDRLARGPLPPRQALQLGLELARGLAAAHDKGVVHRDIKPANVFLCEGGTIKILDFGLAKLAQTLAEGDATQPGVLIGTAGYMAPEQVRGLPADHRADIFALGAVLYEMATGRPAFGGATAVDRMSAALRDDPSPVRGEIGPIIARCLAKDPAARFQSANDLAFFLESLGLGSGAQRAAGSGAGSDAGSDTGSDAARPHTAPIEPPPPRRRRSTAALVAMAAAAALVVAGAGGFLMGRRGQSDSPTTPAAAGATAAADPAAPAVAGASSHPTYRPLTVRRGQISAARFSEDGHTVIYSAAWEGAPGEIFTAHADGPGSRALGVTADALSLSAKGELAILLDPRLHEDHTRGTLARMPLGGGAPRPVVGEVQDADWGPGGEQIAVVRKVAGRFRMEYPLGTVRHETEGWMSHMRVSPDGQRIAFVMHPNPKDDRGSIMVIEGQGAPRELSADWATAQGLAWAPGGGEIWFTASNADANSALYAVDLEGRVRLVDRVAGRLVVHDVAADGKTLVDHQATRLGLVSGRRGEGGERELTWADNSFLTDMTPDGKMLVFAEAGESEGPSYGAYLRATDGAPPVRLGDGIPLAISPNGKQVLAMKYGADVELSLLPTGPGQPHELALAPVEVVLGARFFPDGKRLLLRANEAGHVARLWAYEIGGGPPRPITPEGVAPMAAVSPDGARIAGVDDGGALRIFSAQGEEMGAVPGRFEDQVAVGWDQGGDAVYVRTRSLPVRVSRVELATGAAKAHLTVPGRANWAGLVGVLTMSISADGSGYAYSYYEVLSRLYLVQGLTGVRAP